MKRIVLLVVFWGLSIGVLCAADSLSFRQGDTTVIENVSPNENANLPEKGCNSISGDWLIAISSILVALIIGIFQVISSKNVAKSTIDTNNSTKLREENEKLEERCDNLMKQLYFMYKVEDIALIKGLEGKFEDTNAEGLEEQDKARIEKKNNKLAAQYKKQTRDKAEEIVGYRFNSNYSRRNLLYRSKRTQLDKKSSGVSEYTLYEDIE